MGHVMRAHWFFLFSFLGVACAGPSGDDVSTVGLRAETPLPARHGAVIVDGCMLDTWQRATLASPQRRRQMRMSFMARRDRSPRPRRRGGRAPTVWSWRVVSPARSTAGSKASTATNTPGHPRRVARAVSLSLAFFFAEWIVAPIWSVPMDIAPRYAGTASGMMNFGFAIAGIVSPSTFGYLVDHTGSWVVPFATSVLLLILGAVLASRLRPDIPFEGP